MMPAQPSIQTARLLASATLMLGVTFVPRVSSQTADEAALAEFYGSAEMVSIATGNAQPLRESPAIATVITADDIATRQPCEFLLVFWASWGKLPYRHDRQLHLRLHILWLSRFTRWCLHDPAGWDKSDWLVQAGRYIHSEPSARKKILGCLYDKSI